MCSTREPIAHGPRRLVGRLEIDRAGASGIAKQRRKTRARELGAKARALIALGDSRGHSEPPNRAKRKRTAPPRTRSAISAHESAPVALGQRLEVSRARRSCENDARSRPAESTAVGSCIRKGEDPCFEILRAPDSRRGSGRGRGRACKRPGRKTRRGILSDEAARHRGECVRHERRFRPLLPRHRGGDQALSSAGRDEPHSRIRPAAFSRASFMLQALARLSSVKGR